MPRFFVSESAISENKVIIEGEDAHHISYSLRMAVGDAITVCDGKGKEYSCSLSRLDGKTVEAEIVSETDGQGESPVCIRLFQAYPKGDKLETVIQKSVELGASEIIPFESERCIKRPKGDKIEKQRERMQRIADEAAKQCGRATLPTVKALVSFADMIALARESELAIFCYENCRALSIRGLLEKSGAGVRSISVIIGSEGGFSEREAAEIEAAGIHPVTLGHRILRCETAPTFALSTLAYFYEL